MSSDFANINKEDLDIIYSLIKDKNEPLFFDYILKYIGNKKGEDFNSRQAEQDLKCEMEADRRFEGFSDYYWYLSEFLTDKTLVEEKDLRKLELYISKTKQPAGLEDMLLSFDREGDEAFKNCLKYRLHEDPRFLLIDKDLWYLKSEVPKRVFRTPRISSEKHAEPLSIIDLALPLNDILRDVEELSSRDKPKTMRTKPVPFRYSLTDVDLSVGGMIILSSMKDYFPDHPMLIKIKACGRVREYTAYVNNRTGYIRGLEDLYKDGDFSCGDVILITPMDFEKRVYRFFSRNEKAHYPNENWRLKELKKLKELYRKTPLSLTNLVLQTARVFHDVEVHFDSIYEAVMSIRPTGKDTVQAILEELPFSYKINIRTDFWSFDEAKFNKFLIMGLSSIIGDFSGKSEKELPPEGTGTRGEDEGLKDEKIKNLEKELEKSNGQIKDAASKVEAFEKLAEVRAQQINTLTQSSKDQEKQLTRLKEELVKARKASIDAVELKKMKKRMLTLQELIKNKKKQFLKIEQEKSEMEKALLEMDGITSRLEKEKREYFEELEKTKKDLKEKEIALSEKEKFVEEKSPVVITQAPSVSDREKEMEEKLSLIEKELADRATELARKDHEIKKYRDELEKKEAELLEIQGQVKEKTEAEEIEPGGPPVPVFDISIAGEYEDKLTEKDEKILEIEKKISDFEKLKIDLEEKVRSQKVTISNMTSLISEKEAVVKERDLKLKEEETRLKEKEELIAKLKKELEEAKAISSKQEESRGEEVEDLKERIDILEKELESKTNLYNTNLNMQFKLNKDIYRLQKQSDILKDILTFFSESLPLLPDKENLDRERIQELVDLMNTEEMEEEGEFFKSI